MRDPFCKNESLDPTMVRMVGRIKSGYYDHHVDVFVDYEPETIVWRNPDGTELVWQIPSNVRGTPKGARIEIKNRYRGFYVGEGIMIADARFVTSEDPNHLFEKVWVPCNPHRVRIKPEWKVTIIS